MRFRIDGLRAIGLSLVMAITGMGLAQAAPQDFAPPKGDVVLTIKGAISATNVDGTLQLDQDQLAALPQTRFTTSTTWTAGTPTFQGVLLKDLIASVGATGGTITLKAINDYAITMPVADVATDAPLLAWLQDGKPMALRDKGPVWMVYPYDSDERFRTEETYSRSIWQLTEIDFAD